MSDADEFTLIVAPASLQDQRRKDSAGRLRICIEDSDGGSAR